MPVPQTLAKKLNKDVFQEGGRKKKERSEVHTERRWAHVSDALQAGEEARTGQFQRGVFKKSPSSKSYKSKSASSTAASRMRGGRRCCCFITTPIIRHLNMCRLQMANKTKRNKLNHNDLRVGLLLYNLFFFKIGYFLCAVFFFK